MATAAAELRVRGLVDVSHAARPQMAGDLVMCELAADHVEVTGMLPDAARRTHAIASGSLTFDSLPLPRDYRFGICAAVARRLRK